MDYKHKATTDASSFVLLSDYVPEIIQEIRYYSTYNFIGDRIDGYEEPIAILTKEAARALKSVEKEVNVLGLRLKVFDAYRPVNAIRHFVLWSIEDLDLTLLDMSTGKELDMGSPLTFSAIYRTPALIK